MITPLMLILSSLDEKYGVDKPVNILYLSKSDRDLILSEARRLCELALNPDVVATMEGHVFPTQYSGDNSITLNPYTVAFLERLQACAKVYLEHLKTGDKESSHEDDDLSTQATILRLEGNPDYIYYYVYKMMEAQALSYDVKIAKLAELLVMLNAHSGEKLGKAAEDTEFPRRLELHSNISYWKSMLMGDVMQRTHEMPAEPFTEETIETIRSQINALGFYGFVNPLQMYKDFSSSRIERKSNVNIPDRVIIFLGKVIQSGGGRVQLENNN